MNKLLINVCFSYYNADGKYTFVNNYALILNITSNLESAIKEQLNLLNFPDFITEGMIRPLRVISFTAQLF